MTSSDDRDRYGLSERTAKPDFDRAAATYVDKRSASAGGDQSAPPKHPSPPAPKLVPGGAMRRAGDAIAEDRIEADLAHHRVEAAKRGEDDAYPPPPPAPPAQDDPNDLSRGSAR